MTNEYGGIEIPGAHPAGEEGKTLERSILTSKQMWEVEEEIFPKLTELRLRVALGELLPETGAEQIQQLFADAVTKKINETR